MSDHTYVTYPTYGNIKVITPAVDSNLPAGVVDTNFEYLADHKADKASTPTNNHLATVDGTGNLVDGGIAKTAIGRDISFAVIGAVPAATTNNITNVVILTHAGAFVKLYAYLKTAPGTSGVTFEVVRYRGGTSTTIGTITVTNGNNTATAVDVSAAGTFQEDDLIQLNVTIGTAGQTGSDATVVLSTAHTA